MIDLVALSLSLLSLLDAPLEPAQNSLSAAPLGTHITIREDVRLPWKSEHRYFADGPHFTDMAEVMAFAETLDPPKVHFEKQVQPVKGRIPGELPRELQDLQKLEALLLPPSDRIQVLDSRPATKSLTASRANEAIDFADSGSVPPDAEIAVGPDHVIVAVNVHFRIFSAATGEAQSNPIRIDALLGTPLLGGVNNCSSGLFDPNLLYDEQAERFLMGASKGSDYCLAVSDSSDALGGWTTYSIATDIGGFFFDYPHAGVGQQAFYVGSNQFFDSDNDGDDEFQEARLFAIDKDDLYAGRTPAVTSWSLAGQGGANTPQPLKLYGAGDGSWPISGPDYVLTGTGNNNVTVWSIDDPFGAGTLTRQANLNLTTYTGEIH